MKNKSKLCAIVFIFLISIIPIYNCYAKENIILNDPITDDVAHTFKYPNIEINKDVIPYSITLSIENGHFNAKNEDLNADVSNYFDFKGGTDTSNEFVPALDMEVKYRVITFNLKDDIDITNNTIKTKAILSIENFLSDILYYNDENKDAKFTLSLSETKLTFTDESKGISNLEVVAFKDPDQAKEHYYVMIEDSISWEDAYNIATSLKWNNLQGYLATITSEAEHNFIYNSLGSIEGWIGAASIENSTAIEYNKPNISWNPASDIISEGTWYHDDLANDEKIEQYWYWVAGPEAGKRVFEGYTNFEDAEPNNSTNEWCAEYGYGEGGKWNDYAVDNGWIEGYYIEFGGFEDEQATVEPVLLVNTFKWNDYDFRNVEEKVDDKINEIEYDENTKEEEIQKIIDEAIKETGLDNTSSKVINKKITGNILSFDIEITIGEEDNKSTYTIHIEKEIEIEVPEKEKQQEEKIKEENPKTGDNTVSYLIIGSLSLIGCISLTRKKFN